LRGSRDRTLWIRHATYLKFTILEIDFAAEPFVRSLGTRTTFLPIVPNSSQPHLTEIKTSEIDSEFVMRICGL